MNSPMTILRRDNSMSLIMFRNFEEKINIRKIYDAIQKYIENS